MASGAGVLLWWLESDQQTPLPLHPRHGRVLFAKWKGVAVVETSQGGSISLRAVFPLTDSPVHFVRFSPPDQVPAPPGVRAVFDVEVADIKLREPPENKRHVDVLVEVDGDVVERLRFRCMAARSRDNVKAANELSPESPVTGLEHVGEAARAKLEARGFTTIGQLRGVCPKQLRGLVPKIKRPGAIVAQVKRVCDEALQAGGNQQAGPDPPPQAQLQELPPQELPQELSLLEAQEPQLMAQLLALSSQAPPPPQELPQELSSQELSSQVPPPSQLGAQASASLQELALSSQAPPPSPLTPSQVPIGEGEGNSGAPPGPASPALLFAPPPSPPEDEKDEDEAVAGQEGQVGATRAGGLERYFLSSSFSDTDER